MIIARPRVDLAVWTLPALAPILPVFGSLILWLIAIRNVDVRQMTDLGLVSVLPPLALLALLLLIASYCLALRQMPTNQPVLLLHVVTLIFMLYGVTTIVEEVTRFVIAWRHIGIAEYISRNAAVDPMLDAYHNWPGFFALTALLTEATGLERGIDLAPWASMFFNLLYLGPLVVIMRSVTRDERVVWLSVWLFYLGNWIGQDYYAPQALNYFFHLTVIAVLLTWFRPRGAAASTGFRWLDRLITGLERDSDAELIAGDGPVSHSPSNAHGAGVEQRRALFLTAAEPAVASPIPSGRGLQLALLGILVLLQMAVVSSHQLTPFFLLASVLALVVAGRCGLRGLPILLVVLIAAWAIFPAHGFFDGHFGSLVADASEGNSMAANVTDRLQGSREHLFIVRSRLLFTAGVWGLAALGMLRLLRARRFNLSLALLAAVPFPIVALQPYGGEMLLRVYLFVLPSMVFFVASLLLPRAGRPVHWIMTGVIGLVCVGMLAGFMFARYGNERMDFMTTNEVDAVEWIYARARPVTAQDRRANPNGELRAPFLLTASYNVPWRYRFYEGYEMKSLDEVVPAKQDLSDLEKIDLTFILDQMEAHRDSGAYMLLSRGQAAELELMQGMPKGGVDRLRTALIQSGRFVVQYQNPDAIIFTLGPAPARPAPTGGESTNSSPAEDAADED